MRKYDGEEKELILWFDIRKLFAADAAAAGFLNLIIKFSLCENRVQLE